MCCPVGTWIYTFAAEMSLVPGHLALSGRLLCYLGPYVDQRSCLLLLGHVGHGNPGGRISPCLPVFCPGAICSLQEDWQGRRVPKTFPKFCQLLSAGLSSFRKLSFCNLTPASSLQLELVYLVFIFPQNSASIHHLFAHRFSVVFSLSHARKSYFPL